MATGPVTMPPGTVVFITQNANIIQEGQGVPSIIMQPPGMVQYVGQQFGSPSLGHPQTPQMGLLEKLRKLETKTLGTIQIMMGLLHIGLGGVLIYAYARPSTFFGSYPLWGGAFFIISGSLSVSAENHLKIGLVKCSGGFNSISAIISLLGSILYWILLIGNLFNEDKFFLNEVSTALCALLLMFSTLEFGITALTAYLELKLIRHHNEQAPVFMPYTVSEDPMAAFAPPSYDQTVSSQKHPREGMENTMPPI